MPRRYINCDTGKAEDFEFAKYLNKEYYDKKAKKENTEKKENT